MIVLPRVFVCHEAYRYVVRSVVTSAIRYTHGQLAPLITIPSIDHTSLAEWGRFVRLGRGPTIGFPPLSAQGAHSAAGSEVNDD